MGLQHEDIRRPHTQPSAPTTAPKPTSHIGLHRVRIITATLSAINATAPQRWLASPM